MPAWQRAGCAQQLRVPVWYRRFACEPAQRITRHVHQLLLCQSIHRCAATSGPAPWTAAAARAGNLTTQENPQNNMQRLAGQLQNRRWHTSVDQPNSQAPLWQSPTFQLRNCACRAQRNPNMINKQRWQTAGKHVSECSSECNARRQTAGHAGQLLWAAVGRDWAHQAQPYRPLKCGWRPARSAAQSYKVCGPACHDAPTINTPSSVPLVPVEQQLQLPGGQLQTRHSKPRHLLSRLVVVHTPI